MFKSTSDSQASMTPELARQLLEEGNARFVAGRSEQTNLLGRVGETRGGQWPFAAVLSCIDSRVSAELVFDQGIGDIFSARVAGNVVNGDILGSLEFSCKVAGARLIVILGHESCGAVKGACDGVELGNLTGLLNKIQPSIEATPTPGGQGPRDSSNSEFVQAVALTNVRLAKENLLAQSPVLREMYDAGEIGVVQAMYGIGDGSITFLD